MRGGGREEIRLGGGGRGGWVVRGEGQEGVRRRSSEPVPMSSVERLPL